MNISKINNKFVMNKDIKDVMNLLFEGLNNKSLAEGIDIDPDSKTISYNSSHENNVDTSLEYNPTIDKNIFPNVNVWSIFKRKKGMRGDGNPLVYALKGEREWQFKSIKDKNAIEKQFNLIAEKFATLYPIGVTVIIPSGNSLNKHIAQIVMSKSKNAKLLEGALCKLTVEEVDEIVMRKDSYFRKVYKNNFNDAYKKLCIFFEEMDEQCDGMFSRHLIKDNKMRDAILDTLKITPDRYAMDSKIINGQNILLIDDTISRGQTIKHACEILNESYGPKSITVLTLLSKLYDK